MLFTTVTLTCRSEGKHDDCRTGLAISNVEEAVFSEGPVLPYEIFFCLSRLVPVVEVSISFGFVLVSQIRVFEELFFAPLNWAESKSQ